MFAGKSPRGPYGDAVEELDWIAGQILQTIRDTEMDERTLVFFTSDNGPWLIERDLGGSCGLFEGRYARENYGYDDTGKQSTWECGVHMPAIARWPGMIEPGYSDAVVSSTDILPTALMLAGVAPPTIILDGMNILPVLVQPDGKSPHDNLFLFRGAELWAVRHGPYKLHLRTKSGYGLDPVRIENPPLLFNVEVDPAESNAIPVKDQYKDLVADILHAVAEYNATIVRVADQLVGHNAEYYPCCDRSNGCYCPAREEFAKST